MSAEKPRVAYCTGCGVIFTKMHFLIQHRRLDRCGGRFLPAPERNLLDTIRLSRELVARLERNALRLEKEAIRTGRR